MRLNHRQLEIIPYISLAVLLVGLLGLRPSLAAYVLLLIPITLAAVLHGLKGGLLTALAAAGGLAIPIMQEPFLDMRLTLWQSAWPILLTYLLVGGLIGYLSERERERIRQLEGERRRALRAIREAGQEIAASVDLHRTLRLVMRKAAETLPMDAGILYIFDENDQLYHAAVSYNLPEDQVEKITFGFDEGVPGWVVTQERPLIIDNAADDKRVHPHVLQAGVKSVLAIPLVTREEVVGILNLFCQVDTHAFDDEALQLAQVYADQAAVFIENARLVDELRLAAAELEARVEQRTRQLRETQVQVIRAEKMAAVGRLAGSVAHEINNPLQAIALHLQLVAEDGLSADGQAELDIVQDELDRIAGIVSHLLDFQKPKHGRRTQQTILILLQEVLALSGKQLQQANVTVTCAAEDGLPPVMAMGDRLKQVFLNLVLNAVEAMPDGGRLDIDAAQQNGHIAITFSDSGAGIPPEVMPQLFEPFFSTKHSGTGLGLAVSQEIITAHGGTLTAVSPAINSQGNGHPGATFTVTLPVAEMETAV